jgi:nitrogen fixation NifU-like protein
MTDIYSEMILEYSKNPVNKGIVLNPDFEATDTNPFCGDDVTIQVKLEKNKVKDIKFQGKGCAISQASASILTEMAYGKTLDELRKFDKKTVIDALGIELGPVRLKCALLSLKVLKLGLYKHLGKDIKELGNL